MTLIVEHIGPQCLLQDRGRRGLGHLGVSTSGAFDRSALRHVNALLGNDLGATTIESLGGGLVLLAESSHVVAVAGGIGPITVDARPVAFGRAIHLGPGQRLTIGPVTAGLRTYVGVAGGVQITPELGSMSTDTLAGLGPAPLRRGDVVTAGRPSRIPAVEDVPPLLRAGEIVLDVVLGPRDDWFTSAAVRRLLDEPWLVSSASDRVGVRLEGPDLERRIMTELPSEPCVRGSIQVAADGQPIVFGPDHPVTGGYPVIAVVIDRHTDRLAQARPGQLVLFTRRP